MLVAAAALIQPAPLLNQILASLLTLPRHMIIRVIWLEAMQSAKESASRLQIHLFWVMRMSLLPWSSVAVIKIFHSSMRSLIKAAAMPPVWIFQTLAFAPAVFPLSLVTLTAAAALSQRKMRSLAFVFVLHFQNMNFNSDLRGNKRYDTYHFLAICQWNRYHRKACPRTGAISLNHPLRNRAKFVPIISQ